MLDRSGCRFIVHVFLVEKVICQSVYSCDEQITRSHSDLISIENQAVAI